MSKLAYLSYNIPKRLDPERKGNVTKYRFYKISFLVNDDAKAKGINIGLPWFWYRYGPVALDESLPAGMIKIVPKTYDVYSKVYYGDEPKCKLTDEERALIDSLIDKYGRYTTRELKEDAYSRICNPFLGDLLDFDEHVQRLSTLQDIPDEEREELIDELDSIEANFPDEGFEEVRTESAMLFPILRHFIDRDVERLKINASLVSKFRLLVVTKAALYYNENLAPSLLESKRRHLDLQKDEWRTILR